jgi:hypothetical protein
LEIFFDCLSLLCCACSGVWIALNKAIYKAFNFYKSFKGSLSRLLQPFLFFFRFLEKKSTPQ